MWKLIAVTMILPIIWAQNWSAMKTIFSSSKPIMFSKHWVDKEDNTIHVLYSVMEAWNKEALYYCRVHPTGSISPITEILPGHNHHSNSDISGADDGRLVFMAVSVKRSSDSEYDDIFFSESSDGGQTWSSFTAVPRADMSDKISRYYPNILYSYLKKKVFIYYFTGVSEISEGSIRFVTRLKGASSFKSEAIVFNKESLDGPLRVKITEGGKMNVIHMGYPSKSSRRIHYAYSSDGENWSSTYCSPSYYKDSEFDIAVNTNLPMMVQTLQGFEYNDKLGVRPLYTSNFFSNCLTGEGYYSTPFLPEVFSSDMCEYEGGHVFLTFATRKKVTVGETRGIVFAKSIVKEDTASKVVNPFEAESSITHVYSPSLQCRFHPTQRGHVSLTGIAYSAASEKYYLYLTEARITTDWLPKETSLSYNF